VRGLCEGCARGGEGGGCGTEKVPKRKQYFFLPLRCDRGRDPCRRWWERQIPARPASAAVNTHNRPLQRRETENSRREIIRCKRNYMVGQNIPENNFETMMINESAEAPRAQ
jgi:hypothetical protein